MILIGVSAATIGIIENNEALERVQDADRGFLSRAVKDLQDLINQSLGAGGWLIALSVCVLIGETVAIVLETVPIVLAAINFQPLKLVRQIFVSGIFAFLNSCKDISLSFCRQDIVFSIAVAICYGATGTACAVYAAEWGEPPELCDPAGIDCDDAALTTTNTLSTVSHP